MNIFGVGNGDCSYGFCCWLSDSLVFGSGARNSSNINEVIMPVLNFLFFSLQKDFTSTKKHKTKNVYKKHLSSNLTKSLRQFTFLTNFVETIKFFNKFCLDNLVF